VEWAAEWRDGFGFAVVVRTTSVRDVRAGFVVARAIDLLETSID